MKERKVPNLQMWVPPEQRAWIKERSVALGIPQNEVLKNALSWVMEHRESKQAILIRATLEGIVEDAKIRSEKAEVKK